MIMIIIIIITIIIIIIIIENIDNKYSLTDGITEKIYNKIIGQIPNNLPILNEWLDDKILKKFNNEKWNNSILKLHDAKNIGNFKNNGKEYFYHNSILVN